MPTLRNITTSALILVAALTLIVPRALAGSADAATTPVRVLVLGDSIAAGYGLPEEQALPARLEVALRDGGADVDVINAGVSGDTTAGGLARLDWVLAENPDIVIVELGGNDGLRGIDPEETRRNLDGILTRLREEQVGILLAGMYAPPNLGREYGEEFRAVFEDLAARHDVDFYPFILEGVAADPDLNQDDGIHPNARGVEVIVDNLLPHVTDLIRREAG